MKNSLPGQMISWKMVICGEGAVGKTTLIKSFQQGSFFSGATETIAVEFHTVNLKYLSEKLQIWDLGGQRHYYDMHVFEKYTQEADIALCCFDVTDLETLEELYRWVEILPSDKPRLLVGLKTDLMVEGSSPADIIGLVEEYREDLNFLSFHLLCSKDLNSVNSLFDYITEIVCTELESDYTEYSKPENKLTKENNSL